MRSLTGKDLNYDKSNKNIFFKYLMNKNIRKFLNFI